jgi:hypothetical protein
MENIGDWLYLVIIAVAVISGLFGSSKKKKRQQTTQQNEPKTLKDIFREFERQTSTDDTVYDDIPRREIPKPEIPINEIPKREMTKQEIPAYSTVNQKSQQFTSYNSQQSKYQKKHQEASPSFQFYNQAPIELEEEKPVFSSDDLPHDINEWRKAFIYNEIFYNKFQKMNE